MESFICGFISGEVAIFVLFLHALECVDCVLVDVGDEASIHGRPVTNFQGEGKTSGRGRIMRKCSLYSEIKVLLNKKLISRRHMPALPPADAHASIDN